MTYDEQVLDLALIIDGRFSLPRHNTKRWSKRDSTALKGVVYHQSLENYGTSSGNAKYHSGPNHINTNGLPGLSYTLFVEKSGSIILANNIDDKVYSQGTRQIVGDENALYLSVCFGGNFSAPGYNGPQEPTEEQLISAKVLWSHLKDIWKFKNNQLFGHYDFGKPTCPGYALTEIVELINQDKDWDENELYNLSTMEGRQKALDALGYYCGQTDGIWGPASRGALTNFQKSIGLESDGVWGKKTNQAILEALDL